jgi:hypothetical protein
MFCATSCVIASESRMKETGKEGDFSAIIIVARGAVKLWRNTADHSKHPGLAAYRVIDAHAE